MIAKITNWVKASRTVLASTVCLVLVAWAAYNLGRIYAPRAQNGPSGRSGAIGTQNVARTPTKPSVDKSDPRVVVSKSSSSKKYHYTWCAGAKQIKEANRVWFSSALAAQAAGYSLAGNCTE